MKFLWHFWVSVVILAVAASAWSTNQSRGVSRRTALLSGISGAATLLQVLPAVGADLSFATSSTGLQWADARVGSGEVPKKGSSVSIDYSMSTTGARYGTKIYSTQDKNTPFRFTIGDGTAIKGLEQAIIGGDGVPAMQPGGIRRVIIPSSLGYESLAKPIPGMQYQDCQEGKGVGPIPPVPAAFEEYQRFKNIYCNANRPYQPDLVMDIKLYGKRAP
uniref:peptidylprolyl isomerase n=1 Tax=Fibrocapsa japonica TaxID=94617 RepID=A0A7S2V217_9STRA|mmetsp:Transcript_2630/g.3856  ORF Transcript_2630/g.3856 Transcript_2630/m.3856 type:complete len:218 (+) Transcript_2630:17-670(+)